MTSLSPVKTLQDVHDRFKVLPSKVLIKAPLAWYSENDMKNFLQAVELPHFANQLKAEGEVRYIHVLEELPWVGAGLYS